jgi:hypothetical protein
MTTYNVIFALTIMLLTAHLYRLHLGKTRENHIRTFQFPKGIYAKVIQKYPHLTQKDMELVNRGLRQFFMAYQKSGKQYISMPSQVADELWHEFILHTKNYQEFTKQAFGKFMHHTPAAVLSSNSQSNTGLRRCWKYVCAEENINPHKPSRLPLLFALDSKLNITDGFAYYADCSGLRKSSNDKNNVIHCGGDFSDSSIDGSTDGLHDNSSGSDFGASHNADGHGGGDASGCGGGGCGGGD